MILHSIKVSGWRNFFEEVPLGPFSEGLSVIHAPNGTGKSTLLEALCRGLLDSHNVGGQDIKAIQPWGRALSPTVTIEFSDDGTVYRIAKQFLDGARSELERKEDGKYRPLASGRSADDQVRELLTTNPPGRGLSQPKNWGLAQVLWSSQGSLQLTELSGDLVSDIRDALGVQLSETSTGPIEKQITEVFRQFFSPTGRLKTGAGAPELVRIQERLEQAKVERQEALDLLLEYEETSRKVEDIRARRAQARLDAEELTKTIKQSRGRAEEYRILKSEVEKKRDAAATAEAQYTQLKQQQDIIRSTEGELAEAQSDLKTLKDDAPAKRREVEEREKELARARAALEDARKGKIAVEVAEKEAEAARRYLSYASDLLETDKRIGRIETAEKQLENAQKARAGLVAPEKKTLSAIRKAINQRNDAQTLIDASLISLEIVPDMNTSIYVIAGEQTGARKLSAGAPIQIKGSPEVVAELKGIARLRASGPTGDVEEHRSALSRAQEHIDELTEPYGTTALDKLEELAEKASKQDTRVSQAETELETLLDDDSLDELRQERARQDASLSNIQQDHPDWEKAAPKPDALESIASDLKRELDDNVATADAEREKSQTALSEASEQEKILLTQLAEAEKRVNRLQEHLAEFTRDGKTSKERVKELKDLLMTWEAAKASQADLSDKLDVYEDDPSAALEKLESQLAAADEVADKARDDEVAAETRLESLAGKGPYSVVVAAEEEVARLQDAVRREQLRVDAIKLLYDTISECRTEAVSAVAKPVEQAATRLLQRIAGRRIGSIQLGDVFTPSAVLPETAGEPVGIENLSGGEKEQLYLATRLALADILAKDERQLVVFDDVLTATDAGRLARIMTILEEAAQRLQILVLTCHPERYRGLTGAQFIDLEELVSA